MQGIKRKLVYLSLYEAIAIAINSTVLGKLTGQDMAHTGFVAVVTTGICVVWNFLYNMAFEAWEARQTRKGRGVLRRLAHAVGFEIGLLLLLVPLFAHWLQVTLVQALALNLGLTLFFLAYSMLFTLAFDRVFGLPASALPAGA